MQTTLEETAQVNREQAQTQQSIRGVDALVQANSNGGLAWMMAGDRWSPKGEDRLEN